MPVVVKTAFAHVKTDLTLDKMSYYAVQAVGFDMNDLVAHRLPGKVKNNGLSYYVHDADQTEQLLLDIYSRTTE